MNPNTDYSSLQPYKDAAQQANQSVAEQTAGAPGLLNQLKQNLTSIFAKDNPFIAERGTALQNYLNAPSQSRVSTLPQNLPMVQGSNLNLSPTQQDAITTSNRNAALVPLLGLNQIVTGLYGNIPGMVQGAGDLYNAQIQASKIKADQANQSLGQAMQELQAQEAARQYQQSFAENQRQFNVNQANKGSGSGTPPDLLAYLMATLGGGQQQQQRPPLDSFDQPVYGPEQPQLPVQQQAPSNVPSQPLNTNQNSWWDNIMEFLGATPKNQTLQSPLGANMSSYNIGGLGNFQR